MALSLSQLQKPKQRSKKRVGRGNASGRGTYAGRGLKGQRSRSGGKGGLKRRGVKQFLQQIPKHRGFKSKRPLYSGVNISVLAQRFDEGSQVTPKRMHAMQITPTNKRIKVLGGGTIDKKLHVHAHAFTQSARAAITKAGGSVSIITVTKKAPKKHTEKKAKS